MKNSQSFGVNMKVAIAGYGIEGEENFKYWSDLGADITIFDEVEDTARPLPQGTKTILGKDVFSKMNGFDLVVRTASLNPDKIKTDGKIWSATNEFFEKCPAPIIGVTGTKGKGTTCTLISKILEQTGFKTWLVGNIGTPALEVLDDIKKTYSVISTEVEKSGQISRQARDDKKAIVIFELSSFQLWDIKKSPETAVILMIEPDHLNIHADMDDYVEAKSNIGRLQTEENLMVYHPTNSLSEKAAQISKAKKVRYMTPEGAHLQQIPNSKFQIPKIVIEGNTICDISEVGLMGPHNLENVCAAVTASWRYTQDINAIKNAVTNFKGLPHRLEFVREIRGVKYYDDSYSPNPASTRAAVKSFDSPVVLIAGGYERGADFSDLAKTILNSPVKKVILMGQTAQKIASALASAGYDNYSINESKNLADIIDEAQGSSSSGDVVLLSPGCPSFDMFKNFEERGVKFKEIVGELK